MSVNSSSKLECNCMPNSQRSFAEIKKQNSTLEKIKHTTKAFIFLPQSFAQDMLYHATQIGNRLNRRNDPSQTNTVEDYNSEDVAAWRDKTRQLQYSIPNDLTDPKLAKRYGRFWVTADSNK